MKIELERKQAQVNLAYEKEGLTGEVLDKQLEINKLRHKHNLSDKKKQIYNNFVQ